MRAGRTCLLGLMVAVFLGAGPASASQQSATLGNTTATVTTNDAYHYENQRARVTIVRGGATLLDQELRPTCNYCGISLFFDDAVHVAFLDQLVEPEVVVDFVTGGAHCCAYSLIYRYLPQPNAYAATKHEWGNTGYRLFDPENDGIQEFRSADDRFAYRYGSYVESFFPTQIWRFQAGQMVDVTREYPSIIAPQAARYRHIYNRLKGKHGGLGVRTSLAAYTASECLLGACSRGFSLVKKALRQGHLRHHRYDLGPTGRKFVRKLRSFLRSTGYL